MFMPLYYIFYSFEILFFNHEVRFLPAILKQLNRRPKKNQAICTIIWEYLEGCGKV
jgi:hypothetical protein